MADRRSPLAKPAGTVSAEIPFVDPDTTVEEVAQAMTRADVTAAVVIGEPIGIVTDRDLRQRVLAVGLAGSTPVSEVMTSPAKTLSAEASVGDAIAMMLEDGFQHVPVVDQGRVVGVVDARRALAGIDPAPLEALIRIATVEDEAELDDSVADLPASVDRLLDSGMSAMAVMRGVSAFGDAVTKRAIELSGGPPGEITWVALGSQGRREQGLLTDQDHCMVVHRGDIDEMRLWASGVVDVLAGVGYPRCNGGTMASELGWCHDPGGWAEWVAKRLADTETRAVLELATAMDGRPLTGPDVGLFADMRHRAASSAPFMSRLAAAATGFKVPLGLFGHMSKHFDLKDGVIGPITIIARVYGLAAGSEAGDTTGRLVDAESAGEISADLAELLRQGLEVAQRVRLEHHLDAWKTREVFDNEASLDRLTSWEETLLEQVIKAVKDAQDALESRYQTGYVR